MTNNLINNNENVNTPNFSESLVTSPKNMTDTVLEYINAGLSVIPVNANKRAALDTWKPFQEKRADVSTVQSWNLTSNSNIAIICGAVSGDLECLDIDEYHNIESVSIFTQWKNMVEEQQPGLVDRLVLEQSQNGGYHFVYRCKVVDGNTKLAERATTELERKSNPGELAYTLIETRGEGGYFLCYPSSKYKLLSGDFLHIPIITEEERNILLVCARAFNQYFPASKTITGLEKISKPGKGTRPGDEFNDRGDVENCLIEAGWSKSYSKNDQDYWCRPGKDSGVSATFNNKMQLFYVFTSNASPFESGKPYSKFAVYAYLKHNGSFEDAARDLATQGFGTPTPTDSQENKLIHVENYLSTHYEFRYNEITRRIESREKNNGDFIEVTDKEMNSLFRELHHQGLPINIDALHRIIESDYSQSYDPFKEYFESLPAWESKIDYIDLLAETITLKEPKDATSFKLCLHRWLVGQVACAIEPTAINHTAIILVGKQQGAGKSTWLNKLIPPPLSKYKFVGTINPENKDTLIYLAETMLINLDELETLRKAEIGALKTVMTMQHIKVRPPYGHFPVNMIRRSSFVGSINNTEFLNDPTGSRRFLTFEVQSINYLHNIDMNNVYAQAYTLYRDGFQYWFTETEIAEINERNKRHAVQSYEHELLNQHFEPGNTSLNDGTWQTSTQVAGLLHRVDDDFRTDSKTVRNIGVALVAEDYPTKNPKNKRCYYVKQKPFSTQVKTDL